MAFSAVGVPSDLDLGLMLKIVSTHGVYNNLSEASEMWKLVNKMKVSAVPEGREDRYLIQDSYGLAAIQALPISAGDYPAAQKAGKQEGIALYKDYGLTVEVPRTLIGKSGSELAAYMEPLQAELDAKIVGAARIKSGELYRDGSGAIGILASDATADTSGNSITITLSTTSANNDRSHIGWFGDKDQVKFANTDGTVIDSSSGTSITGDTAVSYWEVTSVDEDANTVTLQAYDSNDALIGIDNTTINADDPSSGHYVYRKGTTPNDVNPASGITDYAKLSEELVGLGSLSQNDDRVVHNITLNSSLGGTREDASAAQINSKHFQKVLSKLKRRCGQDKHAFKHAFMYDTVYDALIEQSETDRRFQTRDDATRGFKTLGYQHGKTFLDFMVDEFCPKSRIYVPADTKEVLEFKGSDFEIVEPNPGQKYHLKNSSSSVTSSGHARAVQSYMEGSGFLRSRQNRALGCIENFQT